MGNIKVQIPTGIGDDKWPEGDALVGNFVYRNGKLAGFVDTKALTVNNSKSTVINYDYFDIELPFTEGEISINRGERSKYFNVRYNPINDDNVIATIKYKGCKTLKDVKAVDPDYMTNDIVDGVWSEGLGDLEQGNENGWYVLGMFASCPELVSFSSDLSSLMFGESMFDSCDNLTSFNANLPSLIDGYLMFYGCSNLVSFSSDLHNLMNGEHMFVDCANLTSFSSDLHNLTNGEYMFYGCSNLVSFSSDLSSLMYGYMMFYSCKLDTASVQNIADTINPNPLEDAIITIDIGNPNPNEQETAAFNSIAAKGWTVQGNGSTYNPTSPAAIITLDENGEEISRLIPYYAKPVEVSKDKATYVGEDDKFYRIRGGQFVYGDDLSTYGMFTCEADAAANMRLTKLEKPSITPSFKKS